MVVVGGVSGDATGIECLAFHSRGHRALQFTETFPQALSAPPRRNRGGWGGSRAQLYLLVETQERVAQRLGTTRISALGSGEARREPRDGQGLGPWPGIPGRELSSGTFQRRLVGPEASDVFRRIGFFFLYIFCRTCTELG